MAKASKKSESKSSAQTSPKAATKAPAAKAKAPPAKKQTSSGAAQAPMIDTNLAASAAAAMILNRAASGTGGGAGSGTFGASGQPAAKKESASFKNMKDSLNKPASQSLGGTFGNIAGQKKSNLPIPGGKQVGRNQTFGADVNRAGVPRRTGGG